MRRLAISFIFCLLFVDVALAGQVCGKRMVFLVDVHTRDVPGVCDPDRRCEESHPYSVPTNCVSSLFKQSGCVCIYEVCCDDSVDSYEDTVYNWGSYDFSSVGDYHDAVRQMINADLQLLTLSDPQEGFLLSDQSVGYVYFVTEGVDKVHVDYLVYKRGLYTKAGSGAVGLQPLPVVPGGSGGGGGSGDGSGNGSGLTVDDVGAGVRKGLEDYFGVFPDDYFQYYPGYVDVESYDPSMEPGLNPISDVLEYFYSYNPLVSALSSSKIIAEPGTCSASVDLFGGVVSIDFDDQRVVSVLNLFGNFIVTVSAIYSIFVLFGRA